MECFLALFQSFRGIKSAWRDTCYRPFEAKETISPTTNHKLSPHPCCITLQRGWGYIFLVGDWDLLLQHLLTLADGETCGGVDPLALEIVADGGGQCSLVHLFDGYGDVAFDLMDLLFGEWLVGDFFG